MADSAQLVLITGGSSGIGAATARLCAEAGWDVCITYRSDIGAAEQVVRECLERGVSASAIALDLATEADIDRLFTYVDEQPTRLAGVVNNAGIGAPATAFADIDGPRVARMFAVNAVAPFLIAREAVRRMAISRGGEGGAIVNVSSRSAELGSPGRYIDYAASKAALDALTVSLGREVAADGVRVNSVRPGVIDTPMHGRNGSPDRAAEMAPTIPMRRPGQPGEIAEAIVWLLSQRASYVTAAILDVSGGR